MGSMETNWARLITCLFVVALALSFFRARDENHSGTVVIAASSKQRVVVAADSRGLTEGKNPNDHQCKITVLGDKLILADTGIASYTNPNLKFLEWTASSEAAEALRVYHKLISENQGLDEVDVVSAEWGRRLAKRLGDEVSFGVLPPASIPQNNVLTQGLFAGLDHDGEIEIRQVFMRRGLPLAGPDQPGPVYATSQKWDISNKVQFSALGKTGIAAEFITGETERARAEARNWQRELEKDPSNDPVVFEAIQLVKLSITYLPPEAGVGGEVDVVELDAHKGVHWVVRKQDCPEITKVPK